MSSLRAPETFPDIPVWKCSSCEVMMCCAVASKRSSFDTTKSNPSFFSGIPRPHDGHSLKGVVVLYGASVTKPSVEESGRFRVSSSFHGSKVSPHRSLIMVQGPDGIVSSSDDFNFRSFCLKLKVLMARLRGFKTSKRIYTLQITSRFSSTLQFYLNYPFPIGLLSACSHRHIVSIYRFSSVRVRRINIFLLVSKRLNFLLFYCANSSKFCFILLRECLENNLRE